MPLIHSIKQLSIRSSVYTVDTAAYKQYSVVKFDGLLNVENIYTVTMLSSGLISCPCFQGKFGRCRHRPILLEFETERRTDKRWFYDWDEHKWYMPIRF